MAALKLQKDITQELMFPEKTDLDGSYTSTYFVPAAGYLRIQKNIRYKTVRYKR